jgi:DDE superfamily endonuclease
VAEIRRTLAPGTPIEIWFQDEMRVGQKKLTYRWARKGSRPRATHDQRTQSAYLSGAVCPALGNGTAIVVPNCNTEAMQFHLDATATSVAPGAHAIILHRSTPIDSHRLINLRIGLASAAPLPYEGITKCLKLELDRYYR